jgi:hypothetical protein
LNKIEMKYLHGSHAGHAAGNLPDVAESKAFPMAALPAKPLKRLENC